MCVNQGTAVTPESPFANTFSTQQLPLRFFYPVQHMEEKAKLPDLGCIH
jgi:hypothetical protein